MPMRMTRDGLVYTSFTPDSTYHGGIGEGHAIREMLCNMRYEGGYKDDHEHGHGRLEMNATDMSYEGEWLEGKFHGEGTFRWKTGSTYTGQWVKGLKEGHGKLTLYSGNVYEGMLGPSMFRDTAACHSITTIV